MIYQVIWSEKSRKSLEAIDKNISERIISKVEDIKKDPFVFVKRLQGVALYSLRVGDYRVILDIENKKMVIFVIKIRHRSKVYDGL